MQQQQQQRRARASKLTQMHGYTEHSMLVDTHARTPHIVAELFQFFTIISEHALLTNQPLLPSTLPRHLTGAADIENDLFTFHNLNFNAFYITLHYIEAVLGWGAKTAN